MCVCVYGGGGGGAAAAISSPSPIYIIIPEFYGFIYSFLGPISHRRVARWFADCNKKIFFYPQKKRTRLFILYKNP